MTKGCLSCARGFHEECLDGCLSLSSCKCLSSLLSINQIGDSTKQVGRPQKPDDQVEDPRSTFRKRAQKVLKQIRGVQIGDPCEWKGLTNCGGGRNPIEGCEDGIVKHVHHGPDKDWTKNVPTNLHGVCHSCHNRWHSANDTDYDPRIPHNPRKKKA